MSRATRVYMLDTNILSYLARNKSPAASDRLLSLGHDELACISVMTEAEILYGLARKPEATALITLMEGLLGSFQVLPWGRAEAKAYGVLRARLAALGSPLGNMDLLIAAHAVAIGAILVTNDRELGKVEGLVGSENWATDL